MNTQVNSQVVNFDNTLQSTNKDKIEFNGFSLSSLCWNNYWIILKTGNLFDSSNIDLWKFVSSQIDGGGIYSKKYWNKTITLSLFIQGESYSDLISRIDQLKKNTRGVEKDFDILVNWEYRTYKATVENINVPDISELDDFVDNVEMTLTVTNWNWTVKSPNSVFLPNLTWSFEVILNNEGTHESFPKIILIFKNSWNAVTQTDVSIKEIWGISPFIVTLPETITDGDVVIFDYVEKTVTINGVEKPFNNPMTPLDVGFNVVGVTFSWSVNLDAYVLYNKVYL